MNASPEGVDWCIDVKQPFVQFVVVNAECFKKCTKLFIEKRRAEKCARTIGFALKLLVEPLEIFMLEIFNGCHLLPLNGNVIFRHDRGRD